MDEGKKMDVFRLEHFHNGVAFGFNEIGETLFQEWHDWFLQDLDCIGVGWGWFVAAGLGD